MIITLLGTGGALPPSGRAQTGILFEKGVHVLLADCGGGILLRLSQAGVDLGRIDAILITHHHLDHMSELLPLITARWLAGHTKTEIYGPTGTRDLVARLIALFPYVRDQAEIRVHEVEPGSSFEVTGFSIRSMAVKHWIPTLAFKIDGRVAYSSDTEPLAEMARFAQGCDLLIHECSSPDGDPMPFHTRPGELGRLLAKSSVKRLVLTHFYPSMIGRDAEVMRSIKSHFSGEVVLAQDLCKFEI